MIYTPAQAAIDHETARDRTLHWTLSFYLPASPDLAAPSPRPVDPASAVLREAIEPLFNDVADRTRLGRIEDALFAAGPAERLTLVMPARARWTTEGKTFEVPIAPAHRKREVGLRSFWYAYGNGAVSWHLSFSAFYGDDLDRDLSDGSAATYYFLSLLQKLAWPKEFRVTEDAASVDALIGIKVASPGDGVEVPFWQWVEHRFAIDWPHIAKQYAHVGDAPSLDAVVPRAASCEVPGLDCRECRSLFFIRDHQLLELIQPKDAQGELASRRTRVSDAGFARYPDLIAAQHPSQDGRIMLSDDYWAALLQPDDAANMPDARERLAYLFLAGFNQNIIDFTNQEASEVLDSLDPIYPNSADQAQEGFFVRYANPRAIITYVSRSRTLEVGNDHLGTCPYAFLLHALSMHNEALTRGQERATFDAIDAVKASIAAGNAAGSGAHEHYSSAERLINQTRIDAFERYDRHRYANPFRYDTERDVFDELERLRGTSRLKLAYEAALASLEEQARDLERLRQANDDAQHRTRDRIVSLLLGALGISGVIQVCFQVDQFMRTPGIQLGQKLGAALAYCGIPILLGVAILYGLNRKPRRE